MNHGPSLLHRLDFHDDRETEWEIKVANATDPAVSAIIRELPIDFKFISHSGQMKNTEGWYFEWLYLPRNTPRIHAGLVVAYLAAGDAGGVMAYLRVIDEQADKFA